MYTPSSSTSVGHQSPPGSLSGTAGFAQPWCFDPSIEYVHGNIHFLLSVVKHPEVERNEKYILAELFVSLEPRYDDGLYLYRPLALIYESGIIYDLDFYIPQTNKSRIKLCFVI